MDFHQQVEAARNVGHGLHPVQSGDGGHDFLVGPAFEADTDRCGQAILEKHGVHRSRDAQVAAFDQPFGAQADRTVGHAQFGRDAFVGFAAVILQTADDLLVCLIEMNFFVVHVCLAGAHTRICSKGQNRCHGLYFFVIRD